MVKSRALIISAVEPEPLAVKTEKIVPSLGIVLY